MARKGEHKFNSFEIIGGRKEPSENAWENAWRVVCKSIDRRTNVRIDTFERNNNGKKIKVHQGED